MRWWCKPGWEGTRSRTGGISQKNEGQGKGSFAWKRLPPVHQVGILIFHVR